MCSLVTASGALPDPRVDSWMTSDSTRYARVRETDAAALAGTATWTGQTLPAYAGVQEIASDASFVYVRSSGLASYVMGPWYLNGARTQVFPNRPLAASRYRRISRTPAPAATKTLTGLGAVGMYVNGVSLFDNRDAFYWNGTGEANGNGFWNRDAWVNESVTFDYGYAHQEQSGNHHYHAQPPALRFQLGDNIHQESGSLRYVEDTTQLHHSPILAWVADGFPIYGPYGYANPTNAEGGVRRMISGFVRRNGQNGTDNLATTGRSTLPAWAQRAYSSGPSPVTGPAVSAQYPLGRYLEDNAYLGDLINPVDLERYELGVDFDLNEYNVRWCVTPEFPMGTWAYFCTLHADGSPAFPYAIGRQYWGTPDLANLTAIPAATVSHFRGGPDATERLESPHVIGGTVTLTWSALEGGVYRVETNSDLTASGWQAATTNVSATGPIASFVEPKNKSQQNYRVSRDSIAPYFGGGNTPTAGVNVSAVPDVASRGAVNLLVTLTIHAGNPPLPPIQVLPSAVTLGNLSANAGSIVRPSASTVTARFNIPAAANPGSRTLTITFSGPGGSAGPSYTQASGFTLN